MLFGAQLTPSLGRQVCFPNVDVIDYALIVYLIDHWEEVGQLRFAAQDQGLVASALAVADPHGILALESEAQNGPLYLIFNTRTCPAITVTDITDFARAFYLYQIEAVPNVPDGRFCDP
ncbi:MAG: hypothetical protein AAF386_03345 [Pseudomonadota bacterium]